jgi:pseudouridine synthase
MKERLQKIIARAGIASRRKAEKLILEGLVKVNGKTVRELGTLADSAEDFIRVEGKVIRPEPLEHFAVHKPRGVLCAASDDRGRKVVTDIVRSGRRLYPAGRLDYESEGLVIVTNDGDLTRIVTEGGRIEKKYRVKVRGVPSPNSIQRLRKGIKVEGESFSRCRIRLLKRDANCWYEVTLKQGRNRQIRRMFEAIGHPVMRLRRIAIGPVEIGVLQAGAYRKLTKRELDQLRSG